MVWHPVSGALNEIVRFGESSFSLEVQQVTRFVGFRQLQVPDGVFVHGIIEHRSVVPIQCFHWPYGKRTAATSRYCMPVLSFFPLRAKTIQVGKLHLRKQLG